MQSRPRLVLSDAHPSATGYNVPLGEEEVQRIVSLRVDEDKSVHEISSITGRSVATIMRYLSRNGISSRTVRKKTPPLDREQYMSVRMARENGIISMEIAKQMPDTTLEEINSAYGSSTYEYYVEHR